MGLFTGIAVYVIIWWVAIFTVLPLEGSPDKDPKLGNATGAPARPLLKRKFIMATVIAAIVWLLIYAVIKSGYFNFYADAEAMFKADRS